MSRRSVDYLRVLLTVEEKGQKALATMEAAKRFNVHPSTVTEFFMKMARLGLVSYRKYYGVSLTEKGRRVVKTWLRRHRLVEKLLVDFLYLDPEEACREATRFDHLISDVVINKICSRYNHPSTCPCGKPIFESEECSRSGGK